MLRATLLQAQVLVEEVIANRMKEVGLGAVIHDGWTYDRMHFFGIIGVWSREFIFLNQDTRKECIK
jgi:hypothetical protein